MSNEMTQEELERVQDALQQVEGGPQAQEEGVEQGSEEQAAAGQQAPVNGTDAEVTLGAKRFRHLPVRLSQEEIAALNHEAAEAADEIDDLESDLKLVKARAKAIQGDIEENQARITRLVRICDAGEEEREVECQEQLDYRDNSVRMVRLDTGETVGEPRAMRDDERQLALLPADGEAPTAEQVEQDADRLYEERRDRAGEEPPEVELEEGEDLKAELKEALRASLGAPEPRILAADEAEE